MLKHNKKRNIGLLNEFFANYMAQALIEFRYDDIDKAKALWEKHVVSNKDLVSELKMFQALHSSNIKNKDVAYDLLKQVKNQCKKQNAEALESAKTTLLHEINNKLNDKTFFEKQVNDYKTSATIQILLNTWRKNKEQSVGLARLSELEDKVLEHITTPKEQPKTLNENILNQTKKDIDNLVVEVFRKKMEKHYENLLPEQKNLLGLYVFAGNTDTTKENLHKTISQLHNDTLSLIEKELKEGAGKTANEKLLEVKKLLTEDYKNTTTINDDAINFYLVVAGLHHELRSEK